MNKNLYTPAVVILSFLSVTSKLFLQTATMPSGSGTSGDPKPAFKSVILNPKF